MIKPLSKILETVIPYAELKSSFFGGIDEAHRYGDLTSAEKAFAHRVMGDILKDTQAMSFTARKQKVKDFIKKATKNEGMPAR